MVSKITMMISKKSEFTRQNVESFKVWFLCYVSGFKEKYPDDKNVMELKEMHTLRVCDEISGIAGELGLSEPEMNLAQIAALFHDLGRFEQFARYHTFSDHRTVNHAQLGATILREQNILDEFDESLQELIGRVVLYHNLPRLPEEENKTCLFFARLLRDADKLDIWQIMITAFLEKQYGGNPGVAFGLPDTPEISDAIFESLLNGRVADVPSMNTLTDYKLLLVGLVYDINFAPSFKRIRERKYLEQIREALPVSDKVDRVFKAVESHIKRKLKSN